MSPRPGGEADKVGNRYELAWAIRHALLCLSDERRSLTVEDVDPELGQGAEFTYVTGGWTEIHQLKRQDGNKNGWGIKALAKLKIFEVAARHVAEGRRFHFVSLIPCGALRELSDRARRSSDLTSFTRDWLIEECRTAFDALAAPEILANPETTWTTLRGMWFEVQGEREVVQVNEMLADATLDGATGRIASFAIGDIILNNLGRRLTKAELLEALSEHDITMRTVGSRITTREQIAAATRSWQESIRRELLQPPIDRRESSELIEKLNGERLALVVGTAGGGKSAVLHQAATELAATGAEVLALRLDRLEPFGSTIDLGRQLGLDTSPAAALAMAADGRDAYLVIDQLDAISLASGRMPASFDIVVDLIGEALSVPRVRVILACREFDIENDHRIRSLAARSDVDQVRVGLIPEDAVLAAVTTMGLDPMRLSTLQRSLLQTPLHLVLLSTIASHEDALAFHSKGSLFEAFWQRKRQAAKLRRENVRFNEVISRVANAASDRQTLSVPAEILDDDDLIEDANVLVSEHVLAQDGGRIAFFHEAFFDYAFARQWASRSESLVEFLAADEQELFRRGQVRQILQHLRERDPARFLLETEAVLTSANIRFHIHQTVLAVIGNLPAPTSDEADVMMRVSAANAKLYDHLWQQLCRPQWFERFYQDGFVTAWLDSDDEGLRTRAIRLMIAGAKVHPETVAVILAARRDAPQYLDWLRRVVPSADLHASRGLFDLIVPAVRGGAFDGPSELWFSVHELANQQPRWAVELIQARLVDHADALAVGDNGKVTQLVIQDHWATEFVRRAAAAEPLAFARVILPYLLDVMAATTSSPRDDAPIRDRHFGTRFPPEEHPYRNLDEVLFAAVDEALRELAGSRSAEVRPLLDTLAADPHDAAQFLLYRALAAGASTFFEWAADLLLEGGTRLYCGYVSDPYWVARELVHAIAPYVDDGTHRRLEEQLRDLRNPYEQRQSFGHTAFKFLSALDEARLTSTGVRRLGEYRRKFGSDAPEAPRGIVTGTIAPPIGAEAAAMMNDGQWLRAMARHHTDGTRWDTFTGGARELSQVLESETASDPARFARLALKMTNELHPAYADAILRGFGDREALVLEDPEPIFDAVRHIASFGHADTDHWLGYALQRYRKDLPLDLVQHMLDRALASSDPADDTPVVTRGDDDGRSAADMRMNGINTARGSLAEALGNALVYDVDGQRTDLVRPHLEVLASDPVLSVRSCVAHTMAACLRHARPDVLAAFSTLIDADDKLLATTTVQNLMIYIGNLNPEVIEPVIRRMLTSDDGEANEAGGALAAFAALEWNQPDLLARAMSVGPRTRNGVAEVCSRNIARTSNSELATTTLITLMNDDDEQVREAVAHVAGHLRNEPLRPFAWLLSALIDSATYEHASTQLLISLQEAPDKVDDLVLEASRQFMNVHGEAAADTRTGAAGDARYISELVVRGLAQSRDRAHRAELLDLLDLLLELGVYGIGEAIAQAERQ